jgi:hypothetical protein
MFDPKGQQVNDARHSGLLLFRLDVTQFQVLESWIDDLLRLNKVILHTTSSPENRKQLSGLALSIRGGQRNINSYNIRRVVIFDDNCCSVLPGVDGETWPKCAADSVWPHLSGERVSQRPCPRPS